jgi:hypothetical protein
LLPNGTLICGFNPYLVYATRYINHQSYDGFDFTPSIRDGQNDDGFLFLILQSGTGETMENVTCFVITKMRILGNVAAL